LEYDDLLSTVSKERESTLLTLFLSMLFLKTTLGTQTSSLITLRWELFFRFFQRSLQSLQVSSRANLQLNVSSVSFTPNI
jgi:hypothetical protein